MSEFECRKMQELEETSVPLSLTLPLQTSSDLGNCKNGLIDRQSSIVLGSPSGRRPLGPFTSSAMYASSTLKRSKVPCVQSADLTDEHTSKSPKVTPNKTSPIVPKKVMEGLNYRMAPSHENEVIILSDSDDSSSESDHLSVDTDLDEVSFMEYCLDIEHC